MDCKFFHCDQKEGEWCEKYPIPRCHNRGGCEYEEEGKRKDTIVMTEDKKIEEICDYIFKYEHYNTFYQYAVACAKAVADYKNREITKLNDKACEWIKANADKYVGRALEEYDMQYYGCISIDNLIDDFKQAMTND